MGYPFLVVGEGAFIPGLRSETWGTRRSGGDLFCVGLDPRYPMSQDRDMGHPFLVVGEGAFIPGLGIETWGAPSTGPIGACVRGWVR